MSTQTNTTTTTTKKLIAPMVLDGMTLDQMANRTLVAARLAEIKAKDPEKAKKIAAELEQNRKDRLQQAADARKIGREQEKAERKAAKEAEKAAKASDVARGDNNPVRVEALAIFAQFEANGGADWSKRAIATVRGIHDMTYSRAFYYFSRVYQPMRDLGEIKLPQKNVKAENDYVAKSTAAVTAREAAAKLAEAGTSKPTSEQPTAQQ